MGRNSFPATGNGAGTGCREVSRDGDGDYTPRPRPAPLPSLDFSMLDCGNERLQRSLSVSDPGIEGVKVNPIIRCKFCFVKSVTNHNYICYKRIQNNYSIKKFHHKSTTEFSDPYFLLPCSSFMFSSSVTGFSLLLNDI